MTDELPQDVILSIQRVLDLKATPNDDPLDVLDNDFNPVDILNNFFPDGKQRSNSSLKSVQPRAHALYRGFIRSNRYCQG